MIPVEAEPQRRHKRSRLTPKEALERAEERVAKQLLKRIATMERLAEGIWFEEVLPDGVKRVVYKKAPDRVAVQYLIDRGMGKPPQAYEVTGDGGGPIEFMPWLPSATVAKKEIIDVPERSREVPAPETRYLPEETKEAPTEALRARQAPSITLEPKMDG